jgi:uncharacterized protein
MHLRDGELVLSATDLSSFLGCRHRTALDMGVAKGALKAPDRAPDPRLESLWQRGREHEARYVASLQGDGVTLISLEHIEDRDERVHQTIAALRGGTDVIVQGALRDGPWFGYPDLMVRVPGPSALGAWSYEISDTKLARETKAGTILQLGLYTEMLGGLQEVRPERFYVVTPLATEAYRVDDYAAYFRSMRTRMLASVALPYDEVAAAHYPEPVDHCDICRWWGQCRDKRRADDHLSLVAGISRVQRRELEARSITTVSALGALPLPLAFKPGRGSRESYERVTHQARLQVESAGRIPPLHELLDIEAERGLCRLPEPTAGDLFLDLEGDPFAAEGGREFLFGLVMPDGNYRARWAFTAHEERNTFEWVMDVISDAIAVHPDMHVFHYAPYEPAAFKRLMGRHATRERELDAMLRAGRFIDLYAVVRQGLRAGVDRYSIKSLEALYGFRREVDLPDANVHLRQLEAALEAGAADAIPPESRDVVEGYNRDDCVSTLRLREWLEHLRSTVISSGTDVPRATLEKGAAPDELDAKARAVEALRERLISEVPPEPEGRSDEEQGRWLLAFMLDYHRREDKAAWWEYFRLSELPTEDLFDEREAVAGLELVERVDVKLNVRTGRPTGTVTDRYSYPTQEMEIDAGEEVWLERKASVEEASRDRAVSGRQIDVTEQIRPVKFGEVVAVDLAALTIDIAKGPKRAEEHPEALFAFSIVRSTAMEESLLRIGESIVADDDRYGAARALLARHRPRLRSAAFGAVPGEDPVAYAQRVVGDLDRTVLAIQGPPGSGKTYCGATMILELVRQGMRVGVVANSHKVIRNLLDEVARQAAAAGAPVQLGQKCDDEFDSLPPHLRVYTQNPQARAALESGEVQVLGGTAWMWARPEFASAVAVLFVDEAGQMALANVVAVSQAAGSLVLLGDPRQLEQPVKGSHPDGVAVSALQHLLGEHLTMPLTRGLFLPQTRRLAPRICEFTSTMFYEGRLTTFEGLERQMLVALDGLPASGLALLEVPHVGNRNYSEEEVDALENLVRHLTRGDVRWIDQQNISHALLGEHILIVSPYNAQVTRLTARLAGTGARVGTVDKFQGQQAPVVIYSMATSSPEDAPRGMEFLYSLNRLNVATSRARCLAVIVASPRLFAPECRSPRQMKLANALCLFREMADHLTAGN